MTNIVRTLLESAEGDASAVQKQLFSLGSELKKDGENITDEEVQAAMLSALIDADGKVANVDVSDIDSIKKEIKESRTYINESGVLHSIEAVGTILGNSAFLHIIAEGLHKLGFKSVDEKSMKAKVEKVISAIKKVTGFPAKVMEKSFAWIADKLGFDKFGQIIAGIAGTILATVLLLALAAYLFPSLSSGVLIVFAITGMVGKSAEIYKLIKELMEYIKEHQAEVKPA
jgi:uncharacterized membrane protein YeaQ/YmgE (transglycosylase-associated protein family)